MDIPISNFIASGGVSAAVVIIFYMTYKACEKKKFKSTCCGASVEVKADLPSPDSTPAPKLVIRTQEESKDIP
jgi:hypothetical protein